MIVLTIVLTILCICNIAELALLLISTPLLHSKSDKVVTEKTIPFNEPAPLYSEDEMNALRRKTQAELEAFQELMSYNADKAYGIDRSEKEE